MARYRAGLETQDRILDATRILLAEVGLEGITLKAICDRAGVFPGSFYNLFQTKEEAVVTVLRQAIAAVDPDPDHQGRDTLKDLVEAFIRFLGEEPVLARIYLQLAAVGSAHDHRLRGRILRHHRNRLDRFSNAMAREHPAWGPAEARRRAEFLLSALNGLTLSKVLDPEMDFGAQARAMLAASTGDA
jgi:AcrR family transcriptional regulator